MTAEIAILNPNGVALAADSAVTIGRAADKIYTSAEKLFQLGVTDPVGVMVYGNASFLGLPWETVIKTYRKQAGTGSLPSVKDHADRFMRFLSESVALFPAERQDETALTLVASVLLDLRDELRRKLNREAEERDGLEDDDIPPIASDVLQSRLKAIRSRDRLNGFTKPKVTALRRRYRDKVKELIGEIFGNLPMADRDKRALVSIAIEMLSRNYIGPLQSGLVFAGFGDEEYLPSLVGFDVEGMTLQQPRSVQSHSLIVNSEASAYVVPFAQQEVVHSFMQGIDANLLEFIEHSTRDLFSGAVTEILRLVSENDSQLGDHLAGVSGATDTVLAGLFSAWRQRQQDFWAPVVANVSSLPKDELAAMAEAFVNLTKFRRRVAMDRETVGGPIDVAVITKGDGFVWSNRKHYFDPALNPRAMSRYHRNQP